MTPFGLSVVIPSFNKAGVLAATLTALEAQTLPADQFEVIVMDDGSTDGTAEMLDSYRPPYPFRWLSQANLGAAAARNAAAAAAAGHILLFLDADIVSAPGLAAAHVGFQETHDASLMVGRIMSLKGAPSAYLVFGQSFDFGPQPRLATPGMGLTQQMSVHTADFERIGGFRTAWPRGGCRVLTACGCEGPTDLLSPRCRRPSQSCAGAGSTRTQGV